jgi:sec-independent protein translocase protein TatA
MGLSFWQVALVAILFLLLFGRGKIPQLMGDLAEGIKSFKKGVSDIHNDEEPAKKVAASTRGESNV